VKRSEFDDRTRAQIFVAKGDLMKKFAAILPLDGLLSLTSAAAQQLHGNFTHAFTEPANQPVWTVTETNDSWKVLFHGSNEMFPAKKVNEAGRQAFWSQMWWPHEQAKNADCLTISRPAQGMICYVPATVRRNLPDLKSNKSNYFYFDRDGGLMEITLLSRTQ
jgi:hypothetical protein